ncbi:hypothetical protein MVES_002237 [Malassezia vespertilionis]|uniref:SWI/SNF and RSC complexes subunit Ssr4 C-terminal domain-containing protein n=1 Tax=Malassezia vespertilionis TaxID=2020962 RepID=A0A2N1JBF4_9BASI|nr:hypothetical protein MVES_002237 [Malassezia vespertilionis]
MRMGEAAHAPSTRGRKRKNPLSSVSSDSANAARVSMPRANGLPGAQGSHKKRPYYNAVFGPEPEEDMADALVDTLDIITPRDLAVARYAQNHAYLEKIFAPNRFDTMQAPASPYKEHDADALKAQLNILASSMEELHKEHKQRRKALNAPEVAQERQDDLEDWQRDAGKGAVLGIGYISARMPQAVAEHFAARRTEAVPHASSAADTFNSVERRRRIHIKW